MSIRIILAMVASQVVFAATAQPLPLSKEVKTGKLANGFNYFIKNIITFIYFRI